MAKKIQFVKIGNEAFIGFLTNDNRTFQGMGCPDRKLNTATLAAFMKMKAKNDLQNISIGKNTEVMVSDLTDSDAIKLQTVKAQWKAAERSAQGWLVSKVFDELLGK